MENTAILTGGDSAEYEISLLSANTAMQHLNPKLFRGYIVNLKDDVFTVLMNGKSIKMNNDNEITITIKFIMYSIKIYKIYNTACQRSFSLFFDEKCSRKYEKKNYRCGFSKTKSRDNIQCDSKNRE